MTDAQMNWLKANPEYALVQSHGVIAFVGWEARGYLFPSGRFVKKDGQTLVIGPAIEVGRPYFIV